LTKVTELRFLQRFLPTQGLLPTELSTLSVDNGALVFALENPEMAR
jgi:hypothetical protein